MTGMSGKLMTLLLLFFNCCSILLSKCVHSLIKKKKKVFFVSNGRMSCLTMFSFIGSLQYLI